MENKNILITGASRGLGKEIAINFASRPDVASIVITARNIVKLNEVKILLTKINPKIDIRCIEGDLSNYETIKTLIKRLKKTKINFNVIINNAGAGNIAPLEDMEDNRIQEIFFINLIAPMLIIKNYLSELRKYRWGRIVNISSISVFKPHQLLVPYIVSKSGLGSLAECVTNCEIKNGITCNTIVPGLMLTDAGKESIKKSFIDYNEKNALEIEQKVSNSLPSRQIVKPSEITALINFLIGESANNISGEYFRVASGII